MPLTRSASLVRHAALACVAVLLLVAEPVARAQPTAPAGGAELVQDGVDGLVSGALSAYAAGDLREARRLFEEAHFAQPTARTFRGLGVLAYRERRWRDAISLLEQSLACPDRPLGPELRDGVQTLIAASQRELGRVALRVAPAEAVVTCDGSAPVRDGAGVLLLEPGLHSLVLSAPGHATRSLAIEAHAGELQSLDVTLPAVSAPLPPSAVDAPPALPAPAPQPHGLVRRGRLRRAAAGLAGVAAGFVVSAVVSASLGVRRIHAIEDHCRATDTGTCEAGDFDARVRHARLSMLATLTNAAAAAAAASAVSSAGLWWLSGRAPSGHPATAIGLTATFRY